MDKIDKLIEEIREAMYIAFTQSELRTSTIIISMLITIVLSVYIFFIYRIANRTGFYSKNFNKTVAIMGIVTGGIVLSMQTSVFISLGMVGALSIVRFRTVVKDPIDTVFMFWAVGEGLALGAGFVDVGLIGALVIGVVMVVVTSMKGASASPYLLILHFDDRASQQIKGLVKQLPKAHVKSKTVQRDGIELTVELRVRESDTDFVDKFLRVPGVFDATLVAHQGDLLS